MLLRLLPALLLLLLLSGPGYGQDRPTKPPRRLDYAGWKLAFADEFDSYKSRADFVARSPWGFHPNGMRTIVSNASEDQYYDSTALSLADGNLVLTATRLAEPIEYLIPDTDTTKQLHYLSGWISLRPDLWTVQHLGDAPRWENNRGFEYGLFEIRCRLADTPVGWPAFWLFNGVTEIDVFEGGANAQGRMRRFSTNVHHNTTQHRSLQEAHSKPFGRDLAQDFHTYTVSWTPTAVTFYFDGRRLRSVPAQRIPTLRAPAEIIANLAILNYNPAANPLAQPPASASMAIDYIRVYKPVTGTYAP